MPSEDAGKSPETSLRLGAAFQLLSVSSTRQEGIELLKVLADEGSAEANYRLGTLYVEGDAQIVDNNLALKYLKRVKGEHKYEADVLTGVVFARGSKNLKPDLAVTRKLFSDVARNLDSLNEACTAPIGSVGPEQQKTKFRVLMMINETWGFLKYYADAYGINFDGLGK